VLKLKREGSYCLLAYLC